MSLLGVRDQFPECRISVRGKSLVYLDSAATTLKPQVVIDRLTQYYRDEVSNIHRGAHFLSDQGTQNFEMVRSRVALYINAPSPSEIVFTRSTTEAVNLVASSFCAQLKAGDQILVSQMEHHSNIVPWQLAVSKKGATVVPFKTTPEGLFDIADFKSKLGSQVKLVAITGCSNVLGAFTQIKELTDLAHKSGAKVLIDAAQLVTCQKLDVAALDCDFLAFSGHKIFGPTGVGILYGKKAILDSMIPFQGGGSMISKVSFSGSTYLESPHRFEAGTPAVGEIIAFGAALEFVDKLGIRNIHAHEQHLVDMAVDKLQSSVGGIEFYGHGQHKAGLISFNVKGAHHSDVSQMLDQQGIAVRSGYLCAQPLMDQLGISGVIRASFSVYNNESDVIALVEGIKKAKEILL